MVKSFSATLLSLAVLALSLAVLAVLAPSLVLSPVHVHAQSTTPTTLDTGACYAPLTCSIGTFNPNKDYFPDKVLNDAVSTPGHFTIRYFPSYKVVTQALSTVNITYVLYMCGTPKPSANVTTTTATAVALTPTVNAATARFFSVPLSRTIVSETVASSYMELLNARAAIAWMDTTYSSSACLAQLSASNTILTYPYEGNTTADALSDGTFVGNDETSTSKMINIASTLGSLHLRMRLEYMNFISLFLNRERVANVLFSDLNARYNNLTALATTEANNTNWSPVVAWVNGLTVSVAPYKVLLVQAAGAQPFAPSVASGYTVTYPNATAFAAALANVDVLIDESYIPTPTNDYNVVVANLGLTNFTSRVRALVNRQVWRLDGRNTAVGGFDFYEQGIVQIDALLADMIRIVNPTLPTFLNPVRQTGYNLTNATQWAQALANAPNRLWFRNIAQGETYRYVSETCAGTSQPLQPLAWRSLSIVNPTCPVPPVATVRDIDACSVPLCATGTFDPTKDYFPNKVPNEAVSTPGHFSIRYFPSYKVINQAFNSTLNITYVLYMCGTPVPSPNVTVTTASAVALTPTVNAATARFFSIPVYNTYVSETVASSYLELLNLRQAIQWMSTTYSSSACLAQMRASNTIYAPNSTGLATSSVAFVGNSYSAASNAVNIASTSGTLHLRMRLEYINFISTFFNREAVANTLFADLGGRFTNYSTMATNTAVTTNWSPVVAWVNGLTVSVAPYKLLLVQSAGAQAFAPSVVSGYTVSYPDASAFAAALANVDILIDESYFSTPTNDYNVIVANLGLTNFTSQVRALVNRQVWRADGRITPVGGSDFYEQGVVQIDALLADVMRIVNPTLPTFLNPVSQTGLNLSDPSQWARALINAPNRLWFRNIAQGETYAFTTETCPSVITPLQPLAWRSLNVAPLTCVLPPSVISSSSSTGGSGVDSWAPRAAAALSHVSTLIAALVAVVAVVALC